MLFLVECSRLLYLENSEKIADSYINNPEKLRQIILDCSEYGAKGVLKLSEETVMNIEGLLLYHKCRTL